MSHHYQYSALSDQHLKNFSLILMTAHIRLLVGHVLYTCIVQYSLSDTPVLCLFSTGTTEKTLVEVLTQRSNAQRQIIAKAYEKATGRVCKWTFNEQFWVFGQRQRKMLGINLPPSEISSWHRGRHPRRLWGCAGGPGNRSCHLRLSGSHQSHQGETVRWYMNLPQSRVCTGLLVRQCSKKPNERNQREQRHQYFNFHLFKQTLFALDCFGFILPFGVRTAVMLPFTCASKRKIVICIQGAGTTESTLTEIFASRSNRQIKVLSEAYLAGKRWLYTD